MTEPKDDLRKFIEKELRGSFRKHPIYNEALDRAKHHLPVGFYQNGKEKTLVHYQCNKCKLYFRNKEKSEKVCVDHIVPVVAVDGGFDWNLWIPSLYCSLDNLQVLCNYPKNKSNPDRVESCHKIKTRLENEQRRLLNPKPKKEKKKK